MKSLSQVLLLTVFAATTFLLSAKEVPNPLPDPDGKPGDASKPLKVYILAGQSNMVGMGNLSEAKNRYASVFLTADPGAKYGDTYIGRKLYQVKKLEIHNSVPIQLGRVDGELPFSKLCGSLKVEGELSVPLTGKYRFYPGHGTSSYNAMKIEGRTVYRKKDEGGLVTASMSKDVELEAGKRYPFEITYQKGGSTAIWAEKVDLAGYGDLEIVTKREGKFPNLVDEEGNWTVRHDVYYQDARINFNGSPLSPTSNGKAIGPELGFGHVLGTYHDEQVLLIKTAMGNRALGWDFRPPSSGKTSKDGADKWESLEYNLMVKGVRKVLANLRRYVPGYKGQGFELKGFVWWQGHKDGGMEGLGDEYEKNLANLINDVRKEFNEPKLPAVIATVGFAGHRMSEKYLQILDAQMSVGDPKRHPKFKGTVASVDTRGYWREIDESPVSQDYHYHRNAETYYLVGEALGRAMVRLHGGKAASLDNYWRDPSEAATSESHAEATPEEMAAFQTALRPMIVDRLVPEFMESAKNLVPAVLGQRPQRPNQFLRDELEALVSYYKAAGISDYDWKPFGPDLDAVKWDYFSFDPKEVLPKDKYPRWRPVTIPKGMEKWNHSNFDPCAAGWKHGLQPFGQLDGKLLPLNEACTQYICGCGLAPKTLWEKEVLLFRSTLEIPKLKEGHRYRLLVGGSAHVNAGDGYGLWINGKLLFESNRGVQKREGAQPRGAYIFEDIQDEFNGCKVTIAAMSFSCVRQVLQFGI